MNAAASQLRRILTLIPECADDRPHSIHELAARAGTTPATLLADVRVLADRFDDPAGFVEAVQIFVDPDRLEVRSEHFLRPMRLTLAELSALELGLALLAAERPPDEQSAVRGARERLEAALARIPRDEVPDSLRHAHPGSAVDPVRLTSLRRAYRERRRLRLRYRKADQDVGTDRLADPLAILFASGMWYLVAQCDGVDGIRIFRVDRIETLDLLDERFEPPTSFDVADVFRDGRAFASDTAERVRIRFTPRVARWIAEREGREPARDGFYVQELPLADLDWLVRYVLQYGAEAEVLEPPAARDAVVSRLRDLAKQLGSD